METKRRAKLIMWARKCKNVHLEYTARCASSGLAQYSPRCASYMAHECAKDSLGLRKAGMTSMSRRLAVADGVYIVLEFYKRYNIPREL